MVAPSSPDDVASEGDRFITDEHGGVITVKAGGSSGGNDEPDEPFPTMPMVAVTIIVACDNIAFTVVFPFLGYLIMFLNLVDNEKEVCVAGGCNFCSRSLPLGPFGMVALPLHAMQRRDSRVCSAP